MHEVLFAAMRRSIIDGDPEQVQRLGHEALALGIDPLEAINRGFVEGVNYVGEQFGLVERATTRGIGLSQLFIDPLVLPAAVRAEATAEVLAAVRELRRTLGTEIYITGGLSNVSFGLPARRVINDVFIALFVEAGGDSGIIDPVAVRPGLDRYSRPWQLATELLLGRDPSGRAFLKAYRSGELMDA